QPRWKTDLTLYGSFPLSSRTLSLSLLRNTVMFILLISWTSAHQDKEDRLNDLECQLNFFLNNTHLYLGLNTHYEAMSTTSKKRGFKCKEQYEMLERRLFPVSLPTSYR